MDFGCAGARVGGGRHYFVGRRVAMTIEIWDSVRLEEQERVTGRDKRVGAPLSGGEVH